MRTSPTRLLPLVAALAVLAACGRRGGGAEADRLPPKRSPERLLADVERALYRPTSAELRGDLRVEGGDFGNVRLNAVVRMQTDSALWVTVRKFGFEGARALVTRDSVTLVNRLEREALLAAADDLPPDLRELLPVEPTLANLQGLFAGQPVGDWTGARVERVPGAYRLALPASRGAAELTVRAGARSAPVRWRYREGERFGEASFADFRVMPDGRVFPYRRVLRYSDAPGDTSRVELALESLEETDDLRFPISVPRGYGAMSL